MTLKYTPRPVPLYGSSTHVISSLVNVILDTLFVSWALSKGDNQKQLPKMFYKKMLFKISQYSQENTCVGVFFNKVAGVIRDSNTDFFLWI